MTDFKPKHNFNNSFLRSNIKLIDFDFLLLIHFYLLLIFLKICLLILITFYDSMYVLYLSFDSEQ